MVAKKVLITGATSGIGYATAKELIEQGAELYFIARNKTRAEEVKSAIGANAFFIADLSSQQSIRKAAAEIKSKLPVIDVLINNAGGVATDFILTEDGIERTIATNHFAYFLLTNLLLENITKSDYARIVSVSSDSHYRGKIDFDSFTNNKGYFVNTAYAQSKLANVLFTKELARRLSHTHVTANCLHPGVVDTQIGNKGTAWYAGAAWRLMTMILGVPLEEGAKTSVYLASSLEVKGVSGKYFDKCREKKPSATSENVDLQKKLWQESERLCQLQ